jgi:YbgC/YbaW family acyl-CoA thioester hydrolase
MKLWLRLIWAHASWRFRPRINHWDVSVRRFHIWPTDIDIFKHMNNGVYLTLMDVARFDMFKRANGWQLMKKAHIHPVVVAENITFRKSLTLGQKFTIESKVIGWNDIAFFIEQRFVVNGEIYARAVVKLRFLKSPKGTPTPDEMFEVLGAWEAPVPVLPKWVVDWDAASALPKGREAAPSEWA